MYRKTFQLKQHTPLIHFQHDQSGATLRASEVKPKLDRFVITQIGNGNFEKGLKVAQSRGFLIGNSTALNYSLQITYNGENMYFCPLANDPSSRRYPAKLSNLEALLQQHFEREINFLAPSPYFANSDKINFQRGSDQIDTRKMKIEEIRWGILAENLLLSAIKSKSMELLKIVWQYLPAFFVTTNFGTRSTKGFGSYTVEGYSDENFVKKSLKSVYSASYGLTTRLNDTTVSGRLMKIFSKVQEDYRRLKSGQSHGRYYKAQTYFYARAAVPEYRWDKRYLKGKIVANKMSTRNGVANLKVNADSRRPELTDEGQDDPPFSMNERYRYIRALLGLAEQFEFQTDQGFNTKYKVAVQHDSIQRYASPIIWKVINDKIYLVANEPNPKMLNAAFNLSLTLDNSRDRAVDIGPLATPSAAEFNMKDFLKYAFDPNAGDDAIQNYQSL